MILCSESEDFKPWNIYTYIARWIFAETFVGVDYSAFVVYVQCALGLGVGVCSGKQVTNKQKIWINKKHQSHSTKKLKKHNNLVFTSNWSTSMDVIDVHYEKLKAYA